MPSPHSLRRLANLTKKVRNDLRHGGMGVNFKYLFRSTAILARVVEVLADHVATQAEAGATQAEADATQVGAEVTRVDTTDGDAAGGDAAGGDATPKAGDAPARKHETIDG